MRFFAAGLRKELSQLELDPQGVAKEFQRAIYRLIFRSILTEHPYGLLLWFLALCSCHPTANPLFGVGWTNTWWLSANRLTSQSSTVEDGPIETWRPASISDELIGSEGVIASLIKDAFHELLTTII